MKHYYGKIPSCGIFCGGCPIYTREKNPCRGAEINVARCEKCNYQLCCINKGIEHCYECDAFPCGKLKSFSKRWKKYGQNIIENQNILKESGKEHFLNNFNSQFF